MVSFLIAEMLRDIIIYKKDVICVFMTNHNVFLFNIVVNIVVLMQDA